MPTLMAVSAGASFLLRATIVCEFACVRFLRLGYCSHPRPVQLTVPEASMEASSSYAEHGCNVTCVNKPQSQPLPLLSLEATLSFVFAQLSSEISPRRENVPLLGIRTGPCVGFAVDGSKATSPAIVGVRERHQNYNRPLQPQRSLESQFLR